MSRIIVFDLFAPFGHFKIPYTTTSPLTFPVPPKTSIYGILGAILGFSKKEYLKYLQKGGTKIGLSIRNPIKKLFIAENLINTKNVKMFARMNSKKSPPRSQIRIEFLKDPYYTIYVEIRDKKMSDKLIDLLKLHKTYYTVSMGLSECLANFRYIGNYEKLHIDSESKVIPLHSILPLSKISESNSLELTEENSRFLRVHLPIEITPYRELVKSEDFIIEITGKPIFVRLENYIHIKELNKNIIVF